MIKISCPNCERCLGETSRSLDAMLICKGCKKKVSIKLDVLSADYFNFNVNQYERSEK